jgi:hypothetical protein
MNQHAVSDNHEACVIRDWQGLMLVGSQQEYQTAMIHCLLMRDLGADLSPNIADYLVQEARDRALEVSILALKAH